MGKWWVKAAIVLAVLVAIIGGGIRLAAGEIVDSQDFRDVAGTQLERALNPILPQAMVHVEQSGIQGLATTVLPRVTIRSGKDPNIELQLRDVRVEPIWTSLLSFKHMSFAASAVVDRSGTVDLQFALPFSREHGVVELSGALEHVDATGFATLLASEHVGPRMRLASGALDGTFKLAKPLGAEGATGKKSGDAQLRLGESMWLLTPDSDEATKLAPLALDVQLRDFSLKLASPVVLRHDGKEATLSGSAELPHRADQPVMWDLAVDAEGSPKLRDTLARLLRCPAAPQESRFHVTGPVAKPACGRGFAKTD